jgi:porin
VKKNVKKTVQLKPLLVTALFSVISVSTFASNIFSSESPWMLGDWNGTRTELKEKGYDFTVAYVGEFAGVISADKNGKGHAYADQWTFGSHFDLNKILDWNDTEALITITHRGGKALNDEADVMAPQFNQTQEVYGRGQIWRLTDLWIKKQFLSKKLDIKVGRFGIGEDFAIADCEFENLALCGGVIGSWAGDQWYNGPVSQWATRIRFNITPELFTQIGVYERNKINADATSSKDGFNFSTDGSDGAIIPLELVWKPRELTQNFILPGEYRIGYFKSTVNSQNVQVDYLQEGISEDFDALNHKWAAWASFKQQLTAYHGDTSRGLSVLGQVNIYDKQTSNFSDAQNIAFVYKGLFDSRLQDEIGLGLARIAINKKSQSYNHLVDDSNFDAEYDAEVYYGFKASNWLTIRPNIQYIKNIGANKTYGDAWVGGLKFNMNF